ncbi:ATP-binding cassette domain-containing protein [Anaerotignum propionicum]|uniref:ATP-binding cassette domain-containing protein n=1 Tax=Anaerotignum propionicum TaxID=28446 RepID=UPI003BEF4100
MLENLSIDIPNGHIIRIYGKSGCGKSTLLDLLPCKTNSTVEEMIKAAKRPPFITLWKHFQKAMILSTENLVTNLPLRNYNELVWQEHFSRCTFYAFG